MAGLRGRLRSQDRGPARSGPPGSISGSAISATVHTEGRWPAAPDRGCRTRGQNCPEGGMRCVEPVTLPPGRRRLATRPNLIGSPPVVNTIGTVEVSVLFGAIIGGSIATLRAGYDRNPDGASTAPHVDVSNSDKVLVAAAEATPAAPNDADTKAEAKESIKPFPIRRVRVRPAVPNPSIPALDATTPTPAGVVASASPLVEPSESAQGSGPPAASYHARRS